LLNRFRTRPELPGPAILYLEQHLPYLGELGAAERRQLHILVARFLRDKGFEGAGGLHLTEAIRLTIAGQACLLHLGLAGRLFPTLRTVIVYPGTYRVKETVRQPEGVQLEIHETRAGESWSHGTLVLSWDDVLDGLADPADGWNVVFHEFAHQLDSETGETNGAPALTSAEDYDQWQRVFQEAFGRLQRRLRGGADTYPFDDYDAESPAEFFAAATELFFEIPAELRAAEPAVYRELVAYYRQDPAGGRE